MQRPLLAGRPWSSRRAGRAARRVPAEARGPRDGLHQHRAMAGAGAGLHRHRSRRGEQEGLGRCPRRLRLSRGRSSAAVASGSLVGGGGAVWSARRRDESKVGEVAARVDPPERAALV